MYGAYAPIDGNGFTLDLPYCNTDMMQLFFDQFSKIKPNEFKINVMDLASFNHIKKLNIFSNIILTFIPPYSPKHNPSERV